MDNIIIYNTDDGTASVKLYANDGTVWMTQAQMAELFDRSISTISRHIKGIFDEQELAEKSNLQKMQIANGIPILTHRGSYSHDEMVRHVTDTYAQFDARRKQSEAQQADADDFTELEREVPRIKHRKQ